MVLQRKFDQLVCLLFYQGVSFEMSNSLNLKSLPRSDLGKLSIFEDTNRKLSGSKYLKFSNNFLDQCYSTSATVLKVVLGSETSNIIQQTVAGGMTGGTILTLS